MATKKPAKKTAPKEEEVEIETNKGVLFKNKRKRKGKKDPDYTGRMFDEDGREYWLSGWVKEHIKYGSYLSLSMTLKEDQEEETEEEQTDASTDDLPF